MPLEITVSLNSASVSINLSTVTFENCFLLFGSVQINLNKFLVSDFQEAFKWVKFFVLENQTLGCKIVFAFDGFKTVSLCFSITLEEDGFWVSLGFNDFKTVSHCCSATLG